jgi:hypothetical protein
MNREPPFQEIPHINSDLRWDRVRLPPGISEADIDTILFSIMKARWQKVAMVVGDAVVRCGEVGLPISDEVLAAQLQALVDSHRIEGVGDLRKWRFSEVRLKSWRCAPLVTRGPHCPDSRLIANRPPTMNI